jgi:hypothetical protein
MEIKRFSGWLNEQATPTKPLVKTGIAKDFAGTGFLGTSAMTADEWLKSRSAVWKTPTEATATRPPIVKKEGTSWFYNGPNNIVMRYMQPDGKNVMEFIYNPGDQLVPVSDPKMAKNGGTLKPADAKELEKLKTVGNSRTTIQTDATGKTLSATAAKFNFNFDSGRYAIEDITPEKSAQLMKDLQPILTELATPKLKNGKLEIVITASTSTLGVSAGLKSQLASAGFPAKNPKFNGNDALCNARLATIEKFIISKFVEALKTTPEAFKAKVQITKNPLPNSGSGTTDEERKQFQYIAAEVKQVGEPIGPSEQLNCGAAFDGKGTQATSEVNYVGFKRDLYIMASVGDKVSLKFNPKIVPDMVYFKYKDLEFLSTWLGAPVTPPDAYKKRNFLDELNTKYPDLEAKINAELKAVGSKGTVSSLAPGAKVNGKWVVNPGPQQKPPGSPEQFSFTLTKNFDLDKLIVRCFSPLEDTAFAIETSCTPTVAKVATPKK